MLPCVEMIKTRVKASLLLVLLACGGSATELVVLSAPNMILIGADSRYSRIGQNPGAELACKIHQSHNLFFASTGLYSDNISGFNVERIVEKALANNSGTPEQLLQSLRARLIAPLQREAAFIKRKDRALYNYLLHDRSILTLVIVPYPSTTFAVYSLDFPFVGTKVTAKPVERICEQGEWCIRVMGSAAAATYVRSHDELFNMDGVKVIDSLMEVGARNDPQFIGLPVSIIQFLPSQPAKWLRQNGCLYVR
ncbi:MAG TPA: hypothetical protein VFA76_07335 [Terriglobales bacterium]|nr:hypothetical protein [Terriglobales bacterium]